MFLWMCQKEAVLSNHEYNWCQTRKGPLGDKSVEGLESIQKEHIKKLE